MDQHEDMFSSKPIIKVVGVGGGGGNAVNRMIEQGLDRVNYVVINTDAQVLRRSKADKRIQIGRELTQGLGAGGDPVVGKKAAEESVEDIKNGVEGAHLVFVTTGMGGGTGTGAAPIVAKCAREAGALVIGIVTKPFGFEGKKRMQAAIQGIEEMKPYVDTLIVISNDKVIEQAGSNTTYLDAFKEADSVLVHAVQGIVDIIELDGLINVDFSDIKKVLQNRGTALLGIGIGKGPGRALQAARQAISSPLLEIDISGATDAIVQITSDDSFSVNELNDVMDLIRGASSPDINIKPGMGVNNQLDGEVVVTIVAAGFVETKQKQEESSDDVIEESIHSQEQPEEEQKESKVPSWLQSRFR